ncbi:hypothetical protein BLA24_15155 [Streptomyces cinnamoneus]|uniref:Uncharacterized protein n=1 Tax=Streptomyces cinnamoneus TaxID=53446 RepID=A0A2G1XIZ4_STRCJ|nr:hypothetical protein [Streptomyces cinnamoneus]PHQ51109.1 hypothetical protein BLA24_15155 [Streptomyces cinnamoneus]PPT13667.1 hypothetical protein CYQ11_12915 [Streptomyces cinnamoneus]
MTQQAEPHAIPGEAADDAAPGESRAAVQRVTHGDGFGAAFCASMAALCAEVVIAVTVGLLVVLSREHDGIPKGPLVITAVTFGALLLTVLISGFVTAVAVMPALGLARRAARRRGREDGRLWAAGAVPVVSAAAVVAFGAVAALGSLHFARPLAYLVWWGALTLGLLPAALAGRAAARRVRDDRPGSVARRVTSVGAVAWLAIGAVGAGVYGSGLVKVYEPPRLTKADMAGTWTDGRGGTVKLASDGAATAEGLDNFTWDGTGKDKPKDCDGSGTWTPLKDGGSVQGVSLRINSCELSRDWSVIGTEKAPRIYHEIGKPGSGKRYVLTKVVKQKK